MATAKDVMKIAIAEIGYKESPKNSNKTKYGKAYGMDGVPWCAEYVWWCFDKAKAAKLFFGGKKSAYVPTIADWGIKEKLTVDKSKGQYGDIVCFDWDKNKVSDHIGFIEKKNSDGSYTTIEGNTSIGNDSNGGEVMRRTRYQSQISYIIRPKYDAEKKTTTTTAKKTTTTAKKTTTVKVPYKKDKTYKLKGNMYVRTGAGKKYAIKKVSALTANGKKHCVYKGKNDKAVLKKGTKVTVQSWTVVGNDIWVKIPSGYICGVEGKTTYVK